LVVVPDEPEAERLGVDRADHYHDRQHAQRVRTPQALEKHPIVYTLARGYSPFNILS
jgi:hypothetical protein